MIITNEKERGEKTGLCDFESSCTITKDAFIGCYNEISVAKIVKWRNKKGKNTTCFSCALVCMLLSLSLSLSLSRYIFIYLYLSIFISLSPSLVVHWVYYRVPCCAASDIIANQTTRNYFGFWRAKWPLLILLVGSYLIPSLRRDLFLGVFNLPPPPLDFFVFDFKLKK